MDETGGMAERDIQDRAEVKAHVDIAENRDLKGSRAPPDGLVFMDLQDQKEKTGILVQLALWADRYAMPLQISTNQNREQR